MEQKEKLVKANWFFLPYKYYQKSESEDPLAFPKSHGEHWMLSVLHKELEYKVEKLKYEKAGGNAAEDQNQIRTSSW